MVLYLYFLIKNDFLWHCNSKQGRKRPLDTLKKMIKRIREKERERKKGRRKDREGGRDKREGGEKEREREREVKGIVG